MADQRPPLEMRDSGIACYTPSPPPKKSTLPRPLVKGTTSSHRELRRRTPSREKLERNSSEAVAHGKQHDLRLDLSGLITGDESESDGCLSGTGYTGRTSQSEDLSHAELAVAMETPSTGSGSSVGSGSSSRIGSGTGSRDEHRVGSSSSPPASLGDSSSNTLRGVHPDPRRQCESSELEEESEGSVMKVRLKLKSARRQQSNDGTIGVEQRITLSSAGKERIQTIMGHDGKSTESNDRPSDGVMLSKYAPLPGIGLQNLEQEQASDIKGLQIAAEQTPSSVSEVPEPLPQQIEHQNVREQRLRALERSASQSDIAVARKFSVPTPPPQSAKTTVSRREMRMQQFARRKSASQAEAASRQASRTSSHARESSRTVLLAIRLPSGVRVQNLFNCSEPLRSVAEFALAKGESSLEAGTVCLVTNDMPKRELMDLAITIEEAELADRTLLNLQEND